MMGNYYVYSHIRLDTEKVFYFGSGSHLRPYKKNNRNSIWQKIVKEVGYRVEILRVFKTKKEACTCESELIRRAKAIGQAEANMTLGSSKGGPVGIVRSAKTRRKMALAKMGAKNPIHRPEVKAKMVASKQGVVPWHATNRATELNKIQVVDLKTGTRWNSIKEAAIHIGKSHAHLCNMLKGVSRNTTTLMYAKKG